jgi:predicted nucleotide-binding protein
MLDTVFPSRAGYPALPGSSTGILMDIFIGSSTETVKRGAVTEIATWISRKGHTPKRWDDTGVLPATASIWDALVEVAHKVGAALFIFSPDDLTWHREAVVHLPRDNVLLEYGLFTGILGRSKVIMCVRHEAKIASDLHGIIYCGLDDLPSARSVLENWLDALSANDTAMSGNEIRESQIRLLHAA